MPKRHHPKNGSCFGREQRLGRTGYWSGDPKWHRPSEGESLSAHERHTEHVATFAYVSANVLRLYLRVCLSAAPPGYRGPVMQLAGGSKGMRTAIAVRRKFEDEETRTAVLESVVLDASRKLLFSARVFCAQ